MTDSAPRRLRRTPLGDNPAAGTQLGSETITAPLVVENGIPRGTSNPANERSTQPYEDVADVAPLDHAVPAAPSPFKLGR